MAVVVDFLSFSKFNDVASRVQLLGILVQRRQVFPNRTKAKISCFLLRVRQLKSLVGLL